MSTVKGLFTGIAGKEAGSSCMLAVPQLPSQLGSSADEEQVKNVAIVPPDTGKRSNLDVLTIGLELLKGCPTLFSHKGMKLGQVLPHR